MPGTCKPVERRKSIVIRFAGDSGDGMQLTGTQFTNESAIAGNDLGTLPDYPAEIRAPAGTLAGVSAFQLHFSSNPVFTPGDDLDVLVAMNPAALRVNVEALKPNGILIVDSGTFADQNLRKAEYNSNPLTDDSLAPYQVIQVELSRLTSSALKDLGLPARTVSRCRNLLALGITSWLFNRPMETTIEWLRERFKKQPDLIEANIRALKAGYNYGETAELFPRSYEVPPAKIAPGTYRNVTGNTATALGLLAASQKAGRPLFLGSYPITPASDLLHELSTFKHFGVCTVQAEDEIAAVGAAVGAAFGGAIGVTTTSGPGMNLKAETIGLAICVELPIVVCNVQRAGPSTGMPTKTEQADLLQALYGRHGESPLAVLAASTPSDCFETAFEAVRIALKYMTPVIFLSDSYLGNGAEPWKVPAEADLPEIPVQFRTEVDGFFPYLRDEETLSRPWVVPGTPGLEHRIGGLEKEYLTGNVSYVPANHERMVRLRAQKIQGIKREIPPLEVDGAKEGDLLILGWGSTYGAIAAAVLDLNARGRSVGHVQLRYLNPLPSDLGEIMQRFRHVMVPELNLGQLVRVIRAEYLVNAVALNKIEGRPLNVDDVVTCASALLESKSATESASTPHQEGGTTARPHQQEALEATR